jgi:hypothetical protein
MQNDDAFPTSVNEVKAVRAANEALRRDIYAQRMIINQLQDTIKSKMHVSAQDPSVSDLCVQSHDVGQAPKPMEMDRSRSPSPCKSDIQEPRTPPPPGDHYDEPISNGAIGSTDPLGLEAPEEIPKPTQTAYKKKPIPRRMR